MGMVDVSIDEYIALLRNSSLPAIIVEGRGDMIVYRRFEQYVTSMDVDVFPVGGRKNLLSIFRRLNELPSEKKIAFIADKDVWVNVGVPDEYESDQLFFTSGYSIENDVMSDCNVWSYFTMPERESYDAELDRFIRWYALALSRHINNSMAPISLHPNCILDENEYSSYVALGDGEDYPEKLYQEINSNPDVLVRGKSLMGLALRQLKKPGRVPRHDDKVFFEMAAVNPGVNISRIISEVNSFFLD